MKKNIRTIIVTLTALALVACAPTYKPPAPAPIQDSQISVPLQFDYTCETPSYIETGCVQTFIDGSYLKVYTKDYTDSTTDNIDICIYSASDRDFYQEINSKGQMTTQDRIQKGPDLNYTIDKGNIITEEDVSGNHVVYTENIQYVMSNNYITHMDVINPDKTLISYDYYNFKDTHTKLDLSKFDIPTDITERIKE